MTLYDILGPTALAGGAGAVYGSAEVHDVAFWLSMAVAVVAGGSTLVAMWCLTGRVADGESHNIGKHLLFMYVATFATILTVTFVAGQGTLWLTTLT